MNSKAIRALDTIRQALIERQEAGAPVSPMQAFLDECVCQDEAPVVPTTERVGRTLLPGTKARRKGGIYVKQPDGRWLKMKAKKMGRKDPHAGMSISQINRQRSRENRG